MVKVPTSGAVSYGTSEEGSRVKDIEASQSATASVSRQLMYTLMIVAMALVVSSALITSAHLRGEETMLFGLGSGEEQEGANAIATTFATFDPEADYVKETLGDEYFKEAFKNVLESDAYLANVDEVKVAIDEAKAEHKILKVFAEGADAGQFGGAP